MTSAAIRLAIDTGGTFTDVVAIDESSGRLTSTKTATTAADPSVSFVEAVPQSYGKLCEVGNMVPLWPEDHHHCVM